MYSFNYILKKKKKTVHITSLSHQSKKVEIASPKCITSIIYL